MTYGLDAAPLNLEAPVRVYVAATEEQMLSVKVLEYSIRKHASMTTVVIPLHDTGQRSRVLRTSAIGRVRLSPSNAFSFQE